MSQTGPTIEPTQPAAPVFGPMISGGVFHNCTFTSNNIHENYGPVLGASATECDLMDVDELLDLLPTLSEEGGDAEAGESVESDSADEEEGSDSESDEEDSDEDEGSSEEDEEDLDNSDDSDSDYF